MRSFVKIKSSRNGEITPSITDIGKSCTSREFLAPQQCLLTQFTKIKFSRKFPDLQYYLPVIEEVYTFDLGIVTILQLKNVRATNMKYSTQRFKIIMHMH